MEEIYKYYIKYKLYGEDETIEFRFRWKYQELKDTIYQLGRGLARFDDRLIKGLNLIEDIKISEQNYDIETDCRFFIYPEPSLEMLDALWDEAYTICTPEQIYNEYHKDITNQLFRECNITIGNLWTDKGIRLEGNFIFVKWIPFDCGRETKVYEILDIILRLKYFHTDKVITYEMIQDFHMNNLFDYLKFDDIEHENIKNLLKSKMETIRDKLWLEQLPISAQSKGIVFRI